MTQCMCDRTQRMCDSDADREEADEAVRDKRAPVSIAASCAPAVPATIPAYHADNEQDHPHAPSASS
eukprot:CAMPEP_0179430514 /NCGR_PEP_ID=MMETSP0799-20121207/15644_1 /TAXON_ID=46947 /ORGANISM="Geminigera cryophila, Strain CCMP2564" /LENGTH=66 /DNA_ID=CAMNT_0021207001 /DNA_START=384 /DNA_END=582 /DNA_ORIENTATION=+